MGKSIRHNASVDALIIVNCIYLFYVAATSKIYFLFNAPSR